MLDRVRLRLAFLRFVRDPTRTERIFDVVELASSLPENEAVMAGIEQQALGDPEFRKLWEARWVPPLRTDQELVGFGKGSFGRAYHEHLSHNNLKAQFYRSPRVTRPLDYISLRLYQTHDLWHVLLGYDTSPRGEIEVQAFTLAQLRTPISCLLLVGGLLNILANRPASSVPVFSAAVMAHQRGQRCPFLLAYRLEGMLTEPLVRVREAVGLTSEQTAA